VALVLAVGLAIWGIITVWGLSRFEETNDAQIEEYINPVTARVSGYVEQIRYEENQDVQPGDTLVVIDNSEYQLHLAEAEAALSNAEAQLAVMHSNIVSSQRAARVNQSQIEAARAKRWKQQQEYARFEKLLAAESATRQQFENVKTALEVAQADYQASQDAYQASLARTRDVQAQQAGIEAEIKRRQALLDRARLDLGYTVITAPYMGKMGRLTIQKGQLIQAGQTLAFIVNQEEGKWVIANFKETQIRNMYVGQPAEIETDAFPGQKFHGKVASLSPATGSRFSLLPPDNASGNFVKITQRIPVRLELTDGQEKTGRLRAGMNAVVSLRKEQR
jgi:membrane fusion protein (multidrug efflux system)